MRKVSLVLALACVCSWGASAVFAGPGCCKKDAASAKTVGETGTCTKSQSACAGKGDAFPTMIAMVGDEKFECADAAQKAAEKGSAKVKYVVNGKEFDCKDKAMDAYACAAECYADSFMNVAFEHEGKWMSCDPTACGGEKMAGCGSKDAMAKAGDKAACTKDAAKTASAEGCCKSKGDAKMASADGCCKSGGKMTKDAMMAACKKATKFRVAGHEYKNWDDAVAASKKAHEVAGKMKMTYVVDGKSVEDCNKVCPMAKKDGKVQYVVGGEKLNCETMAKIRMAREQCEAAKKALDSTQARA